MLEKEFEHDKESREHSRFLHLYTQEMSDLKLQLKMKTFLLTTPRTFLIRKNLMLLSAIRPLSAHRISMRITAKRHSTLWKRLVFTLTV